MRRGQRETFTNRMIRMQDVRFNNLDCENDKKRDRQGQNTNLKYQKRWNFQSNCPIF